MKAIRSLLILVLITNLIFPASLALAQAADSDSAESRMGVELNAARADFWQMRYEEALDRTNKSLSQMEARGVTRADLPYLIPAYQFLGQVYMAMDDKTQAKAAFLKAVHYDPEGQMDAMLYPPGLRASYESIRKGYLDERAKLDGAVSVRSTPEAKVFLNGVYKGTTPLELGVLADEKHYLTLEREDYRTHFQSFRVPQGSSFSVQEKLAAVKFGKEKKVDLASKPFWKKPVFWVITGAVLAGTGAGIGVAMSGDETATGVPVTVSGSAPALRQN